MVAHPSTSGTSYTAMATVLQMRGEEAGWDYLQKYAGQMLQFTKSGSAPAKFVGAGEAAVGIVFSHDIVKQMEAGLPLVLILPRRGNRLRNWRSWRLLRAPQHLDAAQKWYDWALTADAQALGPKYQAYQAPTVGGVELSHPELLEVNLINYDFQWAGDNKKAMWTGLANEISGGRRPERVSPDLSWYGGGGTPWAFTTPIVCPGIAFAREDGSARPVHHLGPHVHQRRSGYGRIFCRRFALARQRWCAATANLPSSPATRFCSSACLVAGIFMVIFVFFPLGKAMVRGFVDKAGGV